MKRSSASRLKWWSKIVSPLPRRFSYWFAFEMNVWSPFWFTIVIVATSNVSVSISWEIAGLLILHLRRRSASGEMLSPELLVLFLRHAWNMYVVEEGCPIVVRMETATMTVKLGWRRTSVSGSSGMVNRWATMDFWLTRVTCEFRIRTYNFFKNRCLIHLISAGQLG